MSFVHKQTVYDSDLYAYEKGRKRSYKRFLLAVMAELTADEDLEKGEPRPGEYDNYAGWCWAGQQTLADRIGVHDKGVVNKMIKQMWDDGCFNRWRKYRDKLGHWHRQYELDMDFIKRHKRPDDPVDVGINRENPVEVDTDPSGYGHQQVSGCGHVLPVDVDINVVVDLGVGSKSSKNSSDAAGALEPEKQEEPDPAEREEPSLTEEERYRFACLARLPKGWNDGLDRGTVIRCVRAVIHNERLITTVGEFLDAPNEFEYMKGY